MFYKIVVGYLQTNCYIISQDKKAIVIDPGAEPEKILSELKRYGLEVELIISTHKEVTLQGIPDLLGDITNLRQKTLVAEVKSFQKRIQSDSKILLSIADELGKDTLNTSDMDPHLEILVNRGKKEVISSIQNEFRIDYTSVDSFEKVIDFQKNGIIRNKGEL